MAKIFIDDASGLNATHFDIYLADYFMQISLRGVCACMETTYVENDAKATVLFQRPCGSFHTEETGCHDLVLRLSAPECPCK